MVIFQKPHINYGIQQLVLILNHSFKNQTQVYQKQELRSKPDLWQKLLIWFGFITKLCKLLKLFNYCLFCFSLLCFCAPLIAEKWKNFRLAFELKMEKERWNGILGCQTMLYHIFLLSFTLVSCWSCWCFFIGFWLLLFDVVVSSFWRKRGGAYNSCFVFVKMGKMKDFYVFYGVTC